jgi:hypothetical protein
MSVQAKSFSEKIVPLSAKDQWRPIRNIRSLVFIVVRDILDEEFMKTSLDKLIRDHIPLLGSRVKPSGADGLLQYHSISPFPNSYEIFRWSVSNVGSTIEETKLVPEQNSQKGVTILPDVTGLESSWIPTDWPVLRRQDTPETPLLLVHLTYYTNATVISINLPHCVGDQLGYGSVIRSWTDIMKGKEPLPFIDLPEGALDGSKRISKKELYKKYEYRLKTKRDRAEILMGIIPELVARSQETRCIIFFPVGILERLRERWRKELQAKYGSEAVNITNGDVIAGIIIKVWHPHSSVFLD